MGKNYLKPSQSMARVSSASTETDYIPATVPFDWEAAPGRSAAVEKEIVEPPSLPLPPGRRPKDGFFLPIPRSAQSPNLQNEEGGIESPHRERRPFKLKFPGSSKKSLFRSRKPRKIIADTDAGSIFHPLSGHRFGSRITRQVLVESQKSPSCFGQCLTVGSKGSSSRIDHRGRGLNAVEDSDGDEHYFAPRSSPLSSRRHGHGQTGNSLIAGAGKQLQVPSSRFKMASMLLSLCPSESDDSDHAEAVDGGNGITDDNGDEASISEHLTTPKAPVPGSCRSGKLQQARPGTDDFTNESDQRHTVADCKGEVADAHSVTASPDKELRLRPTKGSSQSQFSWKSSDRVRTELDPLAAFVATNVQEAGESEFAKERSENVDGEEDIERRGSCSSLERNFSSRRSSRLSSLDKVVWSGSKHSSTPTGKNAVLPDPAARNMVESLATPRSSCGSSDYSFITSCSLDHPKDEVEGGRSTSCCAAPTAEPSLLGRNYFEERLEPNQPLATRLISSLPHSLLQNQARLHITIPKAYRIEDKKVLSNSPSWMEELKSSSLWPTRAPKMSAHGDAGNGDSGNESGEDFENSSTDSCEYGTPRADSSIPSLISPVFGNLKTSPKPATWVVSEEVIKSSALLKCKLQRQQSHEPPRSSFMLEQETTTVPSSSTAFEQIDVTAPCAPDECQVNSPVHGSEGENLAVPPEGGLSEKSKSSSGVMSEAAQGESKAGVGSSGKSFPIYLRRRGNTIITGKAISSGDESGEDFENSSTDSSEHGSPRAVSPISSLNSPVFCKFYTSLEPHETWVVSEEEVLKSSSLLKCKLQRQLHSMGLPTNSLDVAEHFENSSTDSFEHGTPRAVSPIPPLNSPVFCKFNISLEPETWVVSEEVVSEEVSEEVLKSFSLLESKLQRQLHNIGLQTNSLHGANHV